MQDSRIRFSTLLRYLHSCIFRYLGRNRFSTLFRLLTLVLDMRRKLFFKHMAWLSVEPVVPWYALTVLLSAGSAVWRHKKKQSCPSSSFWAHQAALSLSRRPCGPPPLSLRGSMEETAAAAANQQPTPTTTTGRAALALSLSLLRQREKWARLRKKACDYLPLSLLQGSANH